MAKQTITLHLPEEGQRWLGRGGGVSVVLQVLSSADVPLHGVVRFTRPDRSPTHPPIESELSDFLRDSFQPNDADLPQWAIRLVNEHKIYRC